MPANWFIGMPATGLPQLDAVLLNCPPELRRFQAVDLHVTVAFLGSVEPGRAWQAWASADAIDAGPFTVTLGQLRPFGRPRRPSALAFELDQGRLAVAELLERHENRLRRAAGLDPESHHKSPRPHITIARPGRRASAQVREAAVRWAETVAPPAQPFVLDRIALYTWSQNRRQRLFEIKAERAINSSCRA